MRNLPVNRTNYTRGINGWTAFSEEDKETFILRAVCLFEAWAKETGNYPKGIYKKVKEKEYKL